MEASTNRSPESLGKLLNHYADLDTSMGIFYRRAISIEDSYKRPRHGLICPRSASRIEVKVKNKEFKVNSNQVLWIPKNLEHEAQTKSAIYEMMALYPSEEYFLSLVADNRLNSRDQAYLEKEPILFKRTKWLDDILERYFFERILNRFSPPGCTFFLEKQILNEVARIIFNEKLRQIWGENDVDGKTHDPLNLAIRYIETNLFEKLRLENIAAVARVSESTLLRQFKEKIKQTPYDYVKSRRLDEALILLQKGEYTVADVAVLIGYDDLSGFGKAFRAKFGKPPSSYLPN